MLTSPVRLLLVAISVSLSCAPYVGDPRFGHLQRDHRQFRFQHNIELFEVSNGMRVALIPDDRTNLATIDVRYDVGAAEDPTGKAGLAHLVEHLAFMLRAEPGGPTIFEELGEIALHYNAHTSSDETHYTSTVPIEQLERVIAIEARRMRAPCEQLDEATFRRERDVVLAEEAERATPNDAAWYELMTAVYGAGHPYARPVGSREVAGATRADACAFMEQHYAPNRAYVVISGPFKPAAIRDLVGKTFGPIRRQATRRRVADPLVLSGKRSRHEAPIDHPIAVVVFPRAPWGGDVTFRVAEARLSSVMADADRARDWILDTGVTTIGGPRAPAIAVLVEVDDAGKLTDAVDEVYARAQTMFRELSPRGLAGIRARLELSLVAGWDDLEHRGGWIADFMQYTDHNWFMLAEMKALDQTDWGRAAEELGGVLTRENSHAALFVPSGKKSGRRLAAAMPAGAHDQVPWRAPVDPDEADRPLALAAVSPARVERYTLANGLNVELARDPRSPVVDVRLVFPVGSAHEPADRYGVAYAAAFLLDHDETRRYVQSTLDRLEWGTSRGTNIGWSVSETTTTFSASGVAEWGDWHLWYLSWLIDQGHYNKSQLAEMHREARELSASSDADDVDRGALAFGERLYGRGHPYASPPPDAGAAYLALGVGDLERWKRERYRARGATLVVSGAFDPAQMKRLIDELCGPWSGEAPPPLPAVPAARPTPGPSWLAAADGDARQARIRVGFATQSDPVGDQAARMVVAQMIQDAIRVVREGMGASYGVRVAYDHGASGGALELSGDVDEARAGAILERVLAEIAAVRGDGGVDKEAFVRARRKALGYALARRGGASSMAAMLAYRAGANLPYDHDRKLAEQLAALTPAEVARIAAADLAEARMVVLVRGKPAVVDAAFAAVGVTPTQVR